MPSEKVVYSFGKSIPSLVHIFLLTTTSICKVGISEECFYKARKNFPS